MGMRPCVVRLEAGAQAIRPSAQMQELLHSVPQAAPIFRARNLSRAGDRRTQVTSLILAGYTVARDRTHRYTHIRLDQFGSALRLSMGHSQHPKVAHDPGKPLVARE